MRVTASPSFQRSRLPVSVLSIFRQMSNFLDSGSTLYQLCNPIVSLRVFSSQSSLIRVDFLRYSFFFLWRVDSYNLCSHIPCWSGHFNMPSMSYMQSRWAHQPIICNMYSNAKCSQKIIFNNFSLIFSCHTRRHTCPYSRYSTWWLAEWNSIITLSRKSSQCRNSLVSSVSHSFL